MEVVSPTDLPMLVCNCDIKHFCGVVVMLLCLLGFPLVYEILSYDWVRSPPFSNTSPLCYLWRAFNWKMINYLSKISITIHFISLQPHFLRFRSTVYKDVEYSTVHTNNWHKTAHASKLLLVGTPSAIRPELAFSRAEHSLLYLDVTIYIFAILYLSSMLYVYRFLWPLRLGKVVGVLSL